MKIAVMQPYFLPYIGYWQLINAVDVFVLLDDVNYINRGYINRNNILLNGQPHMFSIPLKKASQNRLISEIKLNFPDRQRHKLLKTVESAYKKAPYFEIIFSLFHEILMHNENDLTSFIENSIIKVLGYLDIQKQLIRSSDLKKDDSLKGQARVLEICDKFNATTYINLPGGKDLYNSGDFATHNIELKFITPNIKPYKQFESDFVAKLSILDILMFLSIDAIRNKFGECTFD